MQSLTTYADAIDHLLEWGYAHGGETTRSLLKSRVTRAYRELLGAHDWPSLIGMGRVILQAPQSTGTVTYTHSTRTLTLSGATWPTSVADRTVRLFSGSSSSGSGIDCDIERRVSDTVIILDDVRNPGSDAVAGTHYTLYCQWYPLPADFMALRSVMDYAMWSPAELVTMTEIMQLYRVSLSQGMVTHYAIGQRPNMPGERAIYLWPCAPATRPLDFTYHRKPSELIHSGKDAVDMAGTISGTAGGVDIVGVGTQAVSTMAGAMLRVADGTHYPTGRAGDYPYRYQYRIRSVTDATHFTLIDPLVETLSGAKYVISSVVDIEKEAIPALESLCELHLASAKKMEWIRDYREAADRALLNAMQASYSHRSEIGNRPVSVASPYTINMDTASS